MRIAFCGAESALYATRLPAAKLHPSLPEQCCGMPRWRFPRQLPSLLRTKRRCPSSLLPNSRNAGLQTLFFAMMRTRRYSAPSAMRTLFPAPQGRICCCRASPYASAATMGPLVLRGRRCPRGTRKADVSSATSIMAGRRRPWRSRASRTASLPSMNLLRSDSFCVCRRTGRSVGDGVQLARAEVHAAHFFAVEGPGAAPAKD